MKISIKKINLIILLLITMFFSVQGQNSENNKVVTLNVAGEGNTKQDALHVALRSAIEQAFGTFISSNTQVLNDELAKDEIVSIANGNIQKYEMLSEVQLPDGRYANTVRATVSVSKLTSFCENKGISVEFKGAVFALNVKQQLLNEQNEVKAIESMCQVLKDISKRSFDYEIKAAEPSQKTLTQIDKDGERTEIKRYIIPLGINVKTNSNLKLMSEYLGTTLYSLSLPNQEVENLTKLGAKVFIVAFCPIDKPLTPKKKNKEGVKLIYLRNAESIKKIADVFFYFRQSILNFSITDGQDKITGLELVNYDSKDYQEYYPEIKSINFFPLFIVDHSGYSPRNILMSKFDSHRWGYYSQWRYEDLILSVREYQGNELQLRLKHNDGEWERTKSKYFSFLNEISSVTPNTDIAKANAFSSKYGDDGASLSVKCIYDLIITFQNLSVGQPVVSLSFNRAYTVEGLSKLQGYSIATNN